MVRPRVGRGPSLTAHDAGSRGRGNRTGQVSRTLGTRTTRSPLPCRPQAMACATDLTITGGIIGGRATSYSWMMAERSNQFRRHSAPQDNSLQQASSPPASGSRARGSMSTPRNSAPCASAEGPSRGCASTRGWSPRFSGRAGRGPAIRADPAAAGGGSCAATSSCCRSARTVGYRLAVGVAPEFM